MGDEREMVVLNSRERERERGREIRGEIVKKGL